MIICLRHSGVPIERLQHKISLYESGEIRQNRSYFDEYDILDD